MSGGSYTLAAVTTIDSSKRHGLRRRQYQPARDCQLRQPEFVRQHDLEATGSGSTLTLAGITSLGSTINSGLYIAVLNGDAGTGQSHQHHQQLCGSLPLIGVGQIDRTWPPCNQQQRQSGLALADQLGRDCAGQSDDPDQWRTHDRQRHPQLAKLTDLDSSSVTVQSGATLTLPNLTSYNNPHSYDNTQFEATGTGSTFLLPGLAGLGGTINSTFTLEAFNGGNLHWVNLATVTSTYASLSASGAGQHPQRACARQHDRQPGFAFRFELRLGVVWQSDHTDRR